jgi:hypothetical protein
LCAHLYSILSLSYGPCRSSINQMTSNAFLSATKLPGKHVDPVESLLYVRLILKPSHSLDRMYSYTDSQWKPSIIPFPLCSFLLTRLFSIPCHRWLFNDMRLLFGYVFSLC